MRLGLLPSAAVVAGLLLPVPALADDRGQALVPELNVYLKLSDRFRLFLLADLARTRPENTTDLELAANLDITLMPMLRPALQSADWARERYLWMRVGYFTAGNADWRDTGPTERRGVLELTGRFELPAQVWMVNRARVDLRDIGGAHSQRYRLRTGLEREFTVDGLVTVPYVQAETLYDSRYGAWNRQIYQAGVEVELAKAWRVETYLARQNDSRSGSGNVDSLGLVWKFYH